MSAQGGTAEVFNTNCDYDVGGCGVTAPDGTFGNPFNKNGGGIWATQIEAAGIKVWHFKRSAIPADIKSDKPDPNKWGMPVMSFVPNKCDIRNAWKKMKIVCLLLRNKSSPANVYQIINISFCGEYAGGEAWNECRKKTGVASCKNYVAKTPSAFDDVYFLINSVKTYNK